MPSPSGGTLSDGDATPWRQAGVGRASEVEGQPRGAGYRGAGGDLLLHLPHLVRVLVSPHPPVSFRAPLEQPQAARGGVLAPLHVGLQALQRRLVLHGPRRGPLLLVGQHQSVLAPPLLRGLLRGLPVICLLRVLHVLCPRLSPLSVHCPAQRRHLRLCRRVPHPQRHARLLGLFCLRARRLQLPRRAALGLCLAAG